ncbi:MAG: PDZ domain-containing protein, partial [Lacinutrix sp.]|uniref:PDZ domain-containing protein n=1 Tax=Lacinutrix sp. TaxID=1937692 RepID=UPI003094E03F
EFGNVQNGILGVTGNSLNSIYAEKLGVGETEGFYVDDVEEDTGAEIAGLKSGDIIKKIDGIEINKFSDLRGYLNTKRPNDVVNVYFLRNGEQKEASVTLLKNNTVIINNIAVIKNAKPEDLRKYKVESGVKIIKLVGEYAKYLRQEGIESGNIITKINGVSVKSVDEVQKIIKNKDQYTPLVVELINSSDQELKYGFR